MAEGVHVNRRSNKRKCQIAASVCFALYVSAFVVVHLSRTLRQPAANMLYWYYSDNPVAEKVEFYGFWPLRQIAYHFPGFTSRHNLERKSPATADAGL